MNRLIKIISLALINFSFSNYSLAQMKTCKCPMYNGDWWTGCDYFNYTTLVGATQCINDPLILVFEENFEGNSINLDNWTVYDEDEPIKKAVPRDETFIHSKQFYKKENIIVENGLLKIIAKREHLENQNFDVWNGTTTLHLNSTFEFTSGEVDTKWEFGYGEYEIRCKLPGGGGPGWFPAFWGFADVSGLGEIDVFEFYSSHNKLDGFSLKEWDATNHAKWGGQNIKCVSTINEFGSTDFSQGFHTFKVQFLPWVLRWYVDGTMVKEVYKNYQMGNGGAYYPINCTQSYPGNYLRDKTFPFGPMNIKIDLAIQSGDDAPNGNTVFPNSFDIEFVKIYQYTPCQGVININSQSELDALLSTQENYYNVIFGTIINIDNCTLKNKRALRLIASQEVNFGSNFQTETGSFLESSLGSCQSGSYKQPISNQVIYDQSTTNDFLETNNLSLSNEDLVKNITAQNSISPNPLNLKNDILKLRFSNNQNNYVSILSSTGQVIMNNEKINEIYYDIKSESFKSSGVYYIFIQNSSNDKIHHFKLIVL